MQKLRAVHSLFISFFLWRIAVISGQLSAERVKELKSIKENGSLQFGPEVLRFDEIESLKKTEGYEFKSTFLNSIDLLKIEVTDFEKKWPGVHVEDNIAALREKQLPQNKYSHDLNHDLDKLVLDAKIFVRKQFSYRGHACWLNLYTFIEDGGHEYYALANIFKLAKIQSERLDHLIIKQIYEEHSINKQKNKQDFFNQKDFLQKALVIGAGPNGLYTALKLFISGLEVTVVNDRPEKYIRAQTVLYDYKWMNQLSWFLGTAFDKLFDEENGVGKNHKQLYKLQISTKYLEEALKNRLRDLMAYVKSLEKESIFQLFYELAFQEVQFPTKKDPQFKAVLKPSKNCLDCPRSAVFDVLASVAGAADSIRDTYIGIPIEYTKPRRFAITALEKGPNLKKHKLLPATPTTTFAQFARRFVTNKEIKPFLVSLGMDSLIQQSQLLSAELKEKYLDLSKNSFQEFEKNFENSQDTFLKSSTELENLYFKSSNNDLKQENFELRAFESSTSFYLAATMEKGLDFFFTKIEEMIKAAKSKNQTNKVQSLSLLKNRVLRKFLGAIALRLISKTHKQTFMDVINISNEGDASPSNPDKLNFDPNAVNTTIFLMTQASLKTPAKVYKAHGKSALFIALGDSMAIPHFYSGSGVSTGREGVEIAALLISRYNHGTNGHNYPMERLVLDINGSMEDIKAEVKERGSVFAEQLDESNVKKLAKQKQQKTIRWYCDNTKKFQSLNKQYKLRLTCFFKNNFLIRTTRGFFHGIVDEEGQLKVGKKTFETVMQAVFELSQRN